jgi:Fic family protein
MVRRSPKLIDAAARKLDVRARAQIGPVRQDLIARAAAFLLLNDSRSSFAIEGERPSGTRTVRWGQAISEAGRTTLSLSEFDRLQRIVIGDARFVRLGLRDEGGFVGVHDRDTNDPIPDHISARAEDLEDLLTGLVDYAARTLQGGYDPVVAAAALAFGFVYIHPYVDGNGRLHRWLIHHVLAAANYNPPGLVFPVSAAILRHLDAYRSVLETYSRPLLPEIDWRRTQSGNVEVLNDTAAYYRFFDATAHAEFLYACVEQTIEEDLPAEVAFLEAFDRFSAGVQAIIDMPAESVELLQKFLKQNDGHLSRRARERKFAALTPQEAEQIEQLYRDNFEI